MVIVKMFWILLNFVFLVDFISEKPNKIKGAVLSAFPDK